MTYGNEIGILRRVNMNELINELTKWLEEEQKEELQRANECSDFEEISKGDAYSWCADSYRCMGEKLKELKKKYNLK